jgi:nucleotide-binding universal stress UspA family protein
MVAPLAMDRAWLDDDGAAEIDLIARAEAVGLSDAEALTTKGDPVRLVCLAAEDHEVAVRVVGAHDKPAFRRVIDPSVAVGIVRESTVQCSSSAASRHRDESDS